MPDFTITVPIDKVSSLLTGFKKHYGYRDQLPDENGVMQPNPETGTVFAKRMLLQHFKMLYVEGAERDAQTAVATAVATATEEAETLTSN